MAHTARVLRAARVALVTVPLLLGWFAVAAAHDLAAHYHLIQR